MNTGRFVVGYLGTWFVLIGLAESTTLAPLASALAVSIAIAATFIMGEKAFTNIGGNGNAG